MKQGKWGKLKKKREREIDGGGVTEWSKVFGGVRFVCFGGRASLCVISSIVGPSPMMSFLRIRLFFSLYLPDLPALED